MRGLRFCQSIRFKLEEETFYAIKENHEPLGQNICRTYKCGIHQDAFWEMNGLQESMHSLKTECYICCPGLREEGEALLRFAELPSVPLKEESQAWTLLISQPHLKENEIRLFEIVEVFQSNDQGCPSTCSRTASTKNWSFRTVRIILLGKSMHCK